MIPDNSQNDAPLRRRFRLAASLAAEQGERMMNQTMRSNMIGAATALLPYATSMTGLAKIVAPLVILSHIFLSRAERNATTGEFLARTENLPQDMQSSFSRLIPPPRPAFSMDIFGPKRDSALPVTLVVGAQIVGTSNIGMMAAGQLMLAEMAHCRQMQKAMRDIGERPFRTLG